MKIKEENIWLTGRHKTSLTGNGRLFNSWVTLFLSLSCDVILGPNKRVIKYMGPRTTRKEMKEI